MEMVMSEQRQGNSNGIADVLLPKKNILEQAQNTVYGNRDIEYGHPIDNFRNIAALWQPYLIMAMNREKTGSPFLNATDVACLNILQKVARLSQNQKHRDSIVDVAGYAATIERIIDKI
jgi:hypothetical protein